MFIVFNKQKIYSYLVAFTTVITLFVFAFTIAKNPNAVLTASTNKELPIYAVDTQEKKLAFTINCAWNADDIDKILETLKQNEVKVTFFVVGDWVTKYPDAVKKINEAGHEIGNHSNTHPHVNNLSNEENIKQVQECSDKIKSITGKQTILYRAPYGEYNNTVIRAAKSANHVPIQWNLDTLDYTGLTGNEMWAKLDGKLKNGSIILMHNGTEHTADSLDMLLKNTKQAGYKIVTVSELIYKDSYTIDSTGTQRMQ